jgi:hypothetical protein
MNLPTPHLTDTSPTWSSPTGVWRPVWEDRHGRQYVLDGDGEPVYGVWRVPRDDVQPCAIVDAGTGTKDETRF